MTLPELLARVNDHVQHARTGELPVIIGRLEEIKASALAALLMQPPSAAPVAPRLLGSEEAARRLGMSVWMFEERCRAGKIAAVKNGRHWQIAEADIPAIIDSMRVKARRRA